MTRKSLYRLCALTLTVVICVVIFHDLGAANGKGQAESDMERGVWLYKHENYEEALGMFKKAKEGEPGSPVVEYYIGMTYKQLQDFSSAKPHLEAALTLEPKEAAALPELVSLLHQTDQIDEAKKWLSMASALKMDPAQRAFFDGLILMRDGNKPKEAIAAFEDAAKLDSSLKDTAKYFEAFCYMQTKKLTEAKNMFQQIRTNQPMSDMAFYANEYIDAITRKEDADRPLRMSAGYGVAYDSNTILAPDDPALTEGGGNQADWRQMATYNGEYNLKCGERFTLTPAYSLYYAKQSDLGFYDTVSHDISGQMAYNSDKMSIAFPVHYNWVSVDDKAYLSLVGIGNVNNIAFRRDQMFQTTFLYNRKDYLWQPTNYADNRDSNEYMWSAGWFNFFGRNQDGFANFRYTFNYDDTKGHNWNYFGNRFSFSSAVPVHKKARLSMALDYLIQDYWKTNSVYEKKRFDNVLTASSLASINITKNIEAQLQYVFVDNVSTLGIYKYKRNICSVTMKYNY